MPPVVLTIAGSDSSCGAGAQADLKTFASLGCHGLTAITCIVAETPGKVRSIQAVRPEIVRDQLEVLLEAYPIAAIKTGMLFSTAIIRAVAGVLGSLKKLPPLVIDPVMVASSGDHLEMRSAGKRLTATTGASVLLKGGHLRGRTATDLLLMPDWEEREYSAPFIRGVETHGTGCTYSAAIAVGLAKGLPLPVAVAEAKEFITRAIAGALKWPGIAALDQVQWIS
jgi:hydroxymethylpyrimidine/phosphomethylpyrimidine kinase